MAGALVLDEIRSCRCFGQSAIELLIEVTKAVVRTSNFPPPEGHVRWTADACTEIVADWAFDADRGQARVLAVSAATELVSDDDLERYLEAAIRNHLRDRSRATESWARIRAVRRIVERDPEVHLLPAKPVRYCRPTHLERDLFSGDPSPLRDACRGVPVAKPAWNSERRRAPLATAASIRRLVHVIVDCAGSPVLETTVVDVVVHRCEHTPDAVEYPTSPDEFTKDGGHDEADDSPTDRYRAAKGAATAPDDSTNGADVLIAADEVWDSISTREQRLLYAVTQGWSARAIEDRLGISKSTANRVQPKLVDKLKRILPDDQFGRAVVAELARRSQALCSGTQEEGSASDQAVVQEK